MENSKFEKVLGTSTTLAPNSSKSGQTCCVDWVTCSFTTASNLHLDVFNLIGISDLSNIEIVPGARYQFAGYNITYRLGAIDLMYYQDDNELNHWLINMSGQGCRQFEISSSFDFITFFAILANVDTIYTRLDIAIDDYQNIYDVNKFRNAVFNKQCITRLRTWGDHRRGLIATGLDDVTMDNFYLGSSTSRYFLNVYNKKLERTQKGYEVVHDTWTRTEIRLSYEFADLFIIHILNSQENIGVLIKQFLNEKITFLKPSALEKEDKHNRSRLKKDINNHSRWWRKFLNTTETLHLTVYKPDKTLKDSQDWLVEKVSTTLAMWHMYRPEGYGDFIKGITERGLQKFQLKHERKVLNQLYLDKLEKNKKENKRVIEVDVLKQEEKEEFDLKWNKPKVKSKRKENSRPDLKELQDVYWGQVSEQKKIEQANDLSDFN